MGSPHTRRLVYLQVAPDHITEGVAGAQPARVVEPLLVAIDRSASTRLDLGPAWLRALNLHYLKVYKIDERIQDIAEYELRAAVEANLGRGGQMIVMKPDTGEILALARYPTFDLNAPLAPGEYTLDLPRRAVTAPLEPGSLFKLVLLASLDTSLRTGSVFPRGDACSELSTAGVLAGSSNIGAIQMGLRLLREPERELARLGRHGTRDHHNRVATRPNLFHRG